ncbi:hypothetical protein LCGC14_0601300 [marine sediment metagenome]|uniref:HNH endonuclease n=2 Tax=root TaxID=1 RepID=A0A831VXF7_9GAMM|nr:HNH endonuclease [Marinobacter antarcticus]HEA50775.1 HNH endonuclease [Marinobacter antarcticus]
MHFEVGKEYSRKTDIHGRFGGQAQGGISTPKNYPAIFLFTSETGAQHGYRDEYREDGVFWYTGEGQTGDMKMASGNKAIMEHSRTQKTLHLFEYVRKAVVRYIGSAECLGYHEEIRPDREGSDRIVFVFHLDVDSVPDPVGHDLTTSDPPQIGSLKTLKLKSLDELRNAALAKKPNTQSTIERRYAAFFRSQAIKLYALARAKGVCEGCKEPAPFQSKMGPYLECHHLYRVADGGPDHPENVVAICPNCHRRAHYAQDAISFNKELMNIAVQKEASFQSGLK